MWLAASTLDNSTGDLFIKEFVVFTIARIHFQ